MVSSRLKKVKKQVQKRSCWVDTKVVVEEDVKHAEMIYRWKVVKVNFKKLIKVIVL